MAHYFISDLHLNANKPKIVGVFQHFLQEIAKDLSHLYILGDFFDAWIGDDEDSEVAASIKAMLLAVSETGVATYFQHGNRDFLIGNQFAKETGFTLLEECHLIHLFGEPVLLMHGDSLCVDDEEYMKFRAQVRNPQWQEQVLNLPLPQRRAMAAQLREQSQSMNSMKAEDIMDVNQQAVLETMGRFDTKLLIHGHTHRPKIHSLEGDAQRVVLGDWNENSGWYFRVSENEKELIHFSYA